MLPVRPDRKELATLYRSRLDVAAEMLADMCARLEDGEEPAPTFVATFKEIERTLKEDCDLAAIVLNEMEKERDAAKAMADAYRHRAAMIDRLFEAAKEQVKVTIEAYPDLPYQGSLGRLRVQKSPPAVKVLFEDKELTKEVIDLFGIENRFVRQKVTFTLNSQAVKEALEAGEVVPWARIDQSTHLRYPKPPKTPALDKAKP